MSIPDDPHVIPHPIARWGRWSLDGEYLVYRPDPGELDPRYDIHISALASRRGVRERLGQLTGKRWIRPEDLDCLESAGHYLTHFQFLDEPHADAPHAMGWEDYRSLTNRHWSSFLATADPASEKDFHTFFERYPNMLPGPHGRPGMRRHGPILGGVISQPELPGARPKRPDFLLFDEDSASTYAVLIEIEAPSKPWCNDDATPTATLTQALDQLREWRAWFAEPHNMIAFRELYHIGSDRIRRHRMDIHYVLIYGRRMDATRIEAFAKKRADLALPNEFLMTYDRLNADAGEDLTLKLDRTRPDTTLRVVNIPPTFVLNRKNAALFSKFSGREEAIRNAPHLTDERRRFLLERLQAADEYVKRTGAELW